MTPLSFHLICAKAAFLLAISQWADGNPNYCGAPKNLKVVHEWTFFDFTWPNERARDAAISRGQYFAPNVTAFGINKYKDLTFFTFPRFKYGSPLTLGTISHREKCKHPLFKPFPDWESNRLGNCEGLTSVFSTDIDFYGRLWVIDAGVVDIYNKLPDRYCRPKIVAFDLENKNKIVGTFHLPDKVLDCNSLIVDIAVDLRGGHKDDIFVYLTDSYAERIIVFDLHHNSFHRIRHKSFIIDPNYVDFNIPGSRVHLAFGVLSIKLGPECDGDRRVYYHSLSGVKECYVMASTLRDKAFLKNEVAYPDAFHCFSKRRESPSGIEAITDDGIVLFSGNDALSCWNTETDPNMRKTIIVAQNATTMYTIPSLKVIGNEVYGISSRMAHFWHHLLTCKEINYRLLKANVDDLIRRTPCDPDYNLLNKHPHRSHSEY